MRRCKECHKTRLKKPRKFIVVTEKTCTKCKETKPVSEYNKLTKSPDGYKAQCKPCAKLIRDRRKTLKI